MRAAPNKHIWIVVRVLPSGVALLSKARQVAVNHKKVFTSQKGLRSTGGPDLLKWGLPGEGIKSAKVAPTPYVYYPRVL